MADPEHQVRPSSPLMGRTSSPRRHADDDPEREVPVQGNWIWFLTLASCISGLLFGYDTASISSALLHLGPSLSTPDHAVTTWDKSLITSATSFGALAGGLFAGVLADKIGRRGVIWVADLVFFVGAVWQSLSHDVSNMIWGRVVVGLGVGIGSLVVPLYIAELAPSSYRGRLVVISTLFVTVGQLVAYAVGILLSPPHLSPDASWRWILGLGAVPAVLQSLLMLFMPETPRWLLQQGRRAAASRAISLVYGTSSPVVISKLLASIDRGVEPSHSSSSSKPKRTLLWENVTALLTVPGNRRALTVACFLQFLQQACGFNSLMYFSATIFQMVGFENPTAVAMVVAGTNAAFTGVAFTLIDRLGRRRMLLYSIAGMIIGLVLCSLGFSGLPPLHSTGTAAAHPAGLPALTVIASIVLFVATYAAGLGPIPWLCQSEFFRMDVRGLGTGAATATNWLSNLFVAATFLLMVDTFGGTAAFGVYALVCVVGWAVVYHIYPETKGMEIEEIEDVLRDGWGVKK